VDILATALQALSPPPCAPVEAINLASFSSCIVKLVIVPLWRSASDRQRKRARWQSQGVQTRSRHWQPALWSGLAASRVALLARAISWKASFSFFFFLFLL